MTTGTVLSAVLGWLLLVGAARLLGPPMYADFAVLWAFFFGITGLLSGLQQEVTRTVARSDEEPSARKFTVLGPALAVVGSAFLVATLVSAIWANHLFGSSWPWVLLLSLAGFLGYTAQSTVLGALAARRAWGHASTITVLAAAFRLAAVLAACAISPTPPVLVLGIVAGSFAVVALLPLHAVRAGYVVRGAGGVRAFGAATVATMVAGLGAALLTSGFPFLVHLLRPAAPDTITGPLYAGLMMVRTPVLMPVLGLQLMLVAHFVHHRTQLNAHVRRLLGVLGLGGGVLVVVTGLIAPAIVVFLLGSDFKIGGSVLALMVASAVLLAAMAVTTTALVATDRHRSATAGWIVAVLVTVATLTIANDLERAIVLAAVGGPLAGVAMHAVQLLRGTT